MLRTKDKMQVANIIMIPVMPSSIFSHVL